MMPSPSSKSEPPIPLDDARTPCECTELQKAGGHHYACIYGPLPNLPCVRDNSATVSGHDTRMEFTVVHSETGWRLLRVIR